MKTMKMEKSMRIKKAVTGILSVLVALVLTISAISPVFAGEDGLVAESSVAPNDTVVVQFQFSNHSLDMLLQETGQTWKEWNTSTQQSREAASADPISLQELYGADPMARVFSGDDGIYMITGDSLPFSISSMEDAYDTVYRLVSLLGRDADTDLTLTSVITEGNEALEQGERIYVFQEVKGGYAVPGSTVKLVTDEAGQLKAVFNSLYAGLPDFQEMLLQQEQEEEPEKDAFVTNTISEGSEDHLPEEATSELIDADGAEEAVRLYLEQTGIAGDILQDYTSRSIVLQEEDSEGVSAMMTEETLPDVIRWVVYSGSTDGTYLAHYLAADGTYLSHQKVREPGDEAGQTGADTAYFFEKMEADQWTGEVTYLDGETKTITVPVMKDPETGIYYLGDAERRIAFADFYDFAYNDEELTLVSSEDNTGWNEDDLITLDTFLKVWDFYEALGWKGADGLGTPILMLRDMQTENEVLLDNAAFCARFGDWAIFAYDNSLSHYGEALDVWAHEFTHAVTGMLMGYNLYQNDQGAINESESDILGNLCEKLIEEDDDDDWFLGEDTVEPIRSMMDPHAFDQPEYVWDIFYGPHTSKPNDVNDRGGVHINSSILNYLAARLVEECGMPLTVARDFWLRTLCMVTSVTDLPQMADILQWAVQDQETEKWTADIERLIEEGQFRRVDAPETLEEGRKMMTLELPDTPVMQDENWAMLAFQVKDFDLMDLLGAFLPDILEEISSGEEAEYQELAELEDAQEFWAEDLYESAEAGIDEFYTLLRSLLRQYYSWTNGEDQIINLQIEDKPTLYLLLNIDTSTYEKLGAAVYFGGKWHDVIDWIGRDFLMEDKEETDAQEEPFSEEALKETLEHLLDTGAHILEIILDNDNVGEEITEGNTIILPSNGLEEIELLEPTAIN